MRLQVDAGRGAKEAVEVTPNTSMGAVLAEVCKRRRLDASQHALKHQRTMLDGGLTVRFSGLSANALLELVACDAARVAAAIGDCKLAIQLEDGQRYLDTCHNGSTLLQAIEQVAPEALHQAPQPPGVLYMGRCIHGSQLSTTTLAQLGIGRGASALLRLRAAAAANNTEMIVMPATAAAKPAAVPAVPPVAPPARPPAAPSAASPAPDFGGALTTVQTFMQPMDAPMDAGMAQQMVEAAEGTMLRAMILESLQQIQSATAAEFEGARALLYRYARNILTQPAEKRFRTIRQRNAAFNARFGRFAAARQLLRLIGFVEQLEEQSPILIGVEEAVGTPEKLWVLPCEASLDPLHMTWMLMEQGHPRIVVETLLPTEPTVPMVLERPVLRIAGASAVRPAAPPVASTHQASIAAPARTTSSAVSFSATSSSTAIPAASSHALTITEQQVEQLRLRKVAVRPNVRVPRQMQLLPPSDRPAAIPELPEDFFELTEADMRSMAIVSQGVATNAPMQTAAMRELQRLQALREYPHALVRVRLPGGVLWQSAFHPQEPLAHVLTELSLSLNTQLAERECHLFETPPHKVLDSTLSLVEAGLVPAATVLLAWNVPLPREIARAVASDAQQLLTSEAYALLRAATCTEGCGRGGRICAIPCALGTAPADEQGGQKISTASETTLGASKTAGKAAGARQDASEGRPKPKWLKM